jgi:hypothetical protein
VLDKLTSEGSWGLREKAVPVDWELPQRRPEAPVDVFVYANCATLLGRSRACATFSPVLDLWGGSLESLELLHGYLALPLSFVHFFPF